MAPVLKKLKVSCVMYIEFSITKAYFEQAECKCFTESGIVNKGYINQELQDLAMQFFRFSSGMPFI